MAQVRDLVGVDLTGLGSDFDGSVTTDWDASQLAVVTQVLLERGSTDEEVAAVMGGNVLRVLGETLPR